QLPLLADLINSLPMGVLVIDLDGRILEANHEMANFLGLAANQLTDMSLASLWPQSAEEVLTAARSGRQAAGLKLPELTGCFVQIRALSGQSQGAVITVVDPRLWGPLLGQGETQDPLTPYYKKIFESSSDGISIADNEGRLILVNEASASHVGVKPADILGRNVNFLVKQNMASSVVSMDVIQSRKPVTRLIKHHLTNKHVLLTGTPIYSPDGNVHLVVINERDLTNLLELQTNLKQQKQLVDRYKDEIKALQLTELVVNEVVAKSPAMARTVETAVKLAHHGVANVVLITGESGTGKGLLAKLMHSHSPRAEEPFIHINCAALPEALLETELFGYEKGAFTGAAPEGRPGLFEVTGKGTAFLDEIGEMPLALQAKLLTFLDHRQFRRIGGHKSITASCRLIAATNQNLEDLVAKKKFREDLYYRLKVFVLHIQPLKERPDDVLELARREVARMAREHGIKCELDPLAMEALRRYPFPGNVRELLNCLQQAIFLSEEPRLGPVLVKLLRGDISQAGSAARRSPGALPEITEAVSLNAALASAEKDGLAAALSQCRTTREMAAFLGISQAGVSRKLKKHGLMPPHK
ncbi:sigma 54-interacting transcriptional regulator, partial [Deltaproteobacteria bacterium OttesenSCG-928-K17]|nr:sigma 54-interacting transcriptional regulator [Deltaproteobacteria bacterium OttesenSCG-928-K17]